MKDFRELETEIKKASDKFTNIESINEFRIKFLGKNVKLSSGNKLETSALDLDMKINSGFGTFSSFVTGRSNRLSSSGDMIQVVLSPIPWMVPKNSLESYIFPPIRCR